MKFKEKLDIFFQDIASFGGLTFYAIILISFYVLGYFNIANKLLIGLVFLYLIIVFFRIITKKERPTKQSYSNFIERIDAMTFPSMHSARATFLAIALSNFIASFFITIFLTTLALLVCYSRIYFKKHYYIDVIFGIIFGSLIAYLVI